MAINSAPSALRQRSYSGGYMDVGKKGESVVLDWLRRNPQILGVEDLRELRVMREADADCMLTNRDGTISLAEIKTDNYLGVSGNVLFEILRINHTAPPERSATLGWAARSPARYLFYYAPQVNKIYYCKFDDFRKVFQDYTRETRQKMNINIVPTDNIKTTVNVLIPYSRAAGIFVVITLGKPI